MPSSKRGRKVKRAAPPSAALPSLDALPDELLHHVLSFLPAQEAVRMCVLARRWRHLWKSATGLRILCWDGHEAVSVTDIMEFVDHLLLLRGGSPLDTCVLNLCAYEEDIPCMKQWIQHVLMCKVQVLSLYISWFVRVPCFDLGLVSENLKRLKLESQQFNYTSLDFSSCPALESLEFDGCQFIDCHRVSSQSLKFLSFSSCDFDLEFCTYIHAPNLISLWLEVDGWTPLVERMPSLVEAIVKIEFCDPFDCGGCGEEDCPCYPVRADTVDHLVLQGLSEAQSLVLWSDVRLSIFSRDLKCCPIFTNLKTLSLNEYWCMSGDFSSLTCILEHSPVLEKLTLQLFCKESKGKVEMIGSPDTMERSNVISEHLKIVEVKCEVFDEELLKVFKFLSKLGICSFRFQF